MKKIIFMGIFGLLLQSAASAETVFLKNGEKIVGPVLQKTDDFIIVGEKGFVKKYMMAEVDRVEAPIVVSDQVNVDSTLVPGISQEKINLIVKMMQTSGIVANLRNNFQQIIDKAPAERKKDLFGMFNLTEIITKLIPIYDKYYTEEDLQALVNFNESPVGKKILEVTPKIAAETIQVSVAYFKEKSTPAQ